VAARAERPDGLDRAREGACHPLVVLALVRPIAGDELLHVVGVARERA
jgi:hypothetical protein